MRTILKVVDNLWATKVMCIQALKGKKGTRLGDTIVASVKEAHPNGNVKKGKYCRERELTQEKEGDLIKPEPEASYLRAEGVKVDWRQSSDNDIPNSQSIGTESLFD
ncbi:50s ribosomal protein hlp [Quercus suber]|uniref:50s ribosomal protein hlp n=1 Tax=Quercus suber TaxID=58331 RepID=A0AAW0KEI5_QUESU